MCRAHPRTLAYIHRDGFFLAAAQPHHAAWALVWQRHHLRWFLSLRALGNSNGKRWYSCLGWDHGDSYSRTINNAQNTPCTKHHEQKPLAPWRGLFDESLQSHPRTVHAIESYVLTLACAKTPPFGSSPHSLVPTGEWAYQAIHPAPS